MKPIYVDGMNKIIAENQDEYITLHAHVDNEGIVTSCWKLNWKERFHLLFSGKIYLRILAFKQPLQPQLIQLDKPF